MELTPAQLALLTAIADFRLNIHSHLPSQHDLRTHPAVAALGLTSDQVLAELQAGRNPGLFMKKTAAGRDGWVPAYKGEGVIHADKLGGDFYAPKPRAASPVTPSTPAPARTGYQQGDHRYLAIADTAPKPGTVQQHGQAYVAVTAHSKQPFYLSQRVIDDEDLFEFEGQLVTYVYHRPATDEQIAAHLAEQERLAARTPEQHLAEQPVTINELLTAASGGRPQGRTVPVGAERLHHNPGYHGTSWSTLYRTPEGLALHTGHSLNGPTHDTLYVLPIHHLTERQRLGLAALPALPDAVASSSTDEDGWETL